MKRELKTKRIVVKIGTSSLIHPSGQVNLEAIDRLAYALSALKNKGHEVVLVTSGAIGVGLAALNLTERPQAIEEQQALAAIGQAELISLYTKRFSDYGARIGQLLLTHDVFEYQLSRVHVMDTFEALLKQGIIPIVNENDSVAVDELDHHTTFGDNDQLSALVAARLDADLLIVLSDIDGLYDKDPHRDATACLLSSVTTMGPAIMAGASGSSTRFGTGGMVTKLYAAARMLANGKQMVLANGADPRIILQIVDGVPVGTWFHSEEGAVVTNG